MKPSHLFSWCQEHEHIFKVIGHLEREGTVPRFISWPEPLWNYRFGSSTSIQNWFAE